MRFKFNHTSDFAKILIIAQFFLLSYLLYTLTLSVYKNYQVDRHIELFHQENKTLEEENMRIASDIEYVTSDAYIQKITKQNRGLVNPGEEVIVVPKVRENQEDLFAIGETGYNSGEDEVSNFEIWWDYLFERESNLI